ncbi:unnamed protein product [Moneuplotes crassus]|uniref:Uncharacterized protein n=1 Tax=Euplotes crassus TaxID=5936 RepID=A0AAD2CXN1_EUPCR|nr:unnamed protein product [Moneuplotes crassus]
MEDCLFVIEIWFRYPSFGVTLSLIDNFSMSLERSLKFDLLLIFCVIIVESLSSRRFLLISNSLLFDSKVCNFELVCLISSFMFCFSLFNSFLFFFSFIKNFLYCLSSSSQDSFLISSLIISTLPLTFKSC